MLFKETNLKGNFVIDLNINEDKRGFFARYFCKKEFSDYGLNTEWAQINNIFSKELGTLRGLHFQQAPKAEVKLVRCLKGSVLDVALDLRKDSKTYGCFETTVLSQENKNQLFIPKGFAHGFVVLSETAIFSYKVDNHYNSDSESGILWNDPDLKIDWKTPKDEIIISEKDKKLSTFNNFVSPF